MLTSSTELLEAAATQEAAATVTSRPPLNSSLQMGSEPRHALLRLRGEQVLAQVRLLLSPAPELGDTPAARLCRAEPLAANRLAEVRLPLPPLQCTFLETAVAATFGHQVMASYLPAAVKFLSRQERNPPCWRSSMPATGA